MAESGPEALAGLFAADQVVRDHTPLGWPDMDLDAYVDRVAELTSLVQATLIENFGIDDLDAALARFEEITVASPDE